MFTPFKAAVFSIVAMTLMVVGSTALVNTAGAQEAPVANQEEYKLGFKPKCTNVDKTIMYWEVFNEGTTANVMQWQNRDNGTSGTFVAQPGVSDMPVTTTPGVNNTTDFMWQYGVSTSNSLSDAICEAPAPEPVVCIDGRIQQNIKYVMVNPGTYTVETIDGRPLCDDVIIFLSSYIMPANYNGQGFYNNPTATPQSIFSSTSAVLAKGTNGMQTLTIALPDSCNNVQTDLYYGPEITYLPAGDNVGHGTQNIRSETYMSTGQCGGGNGGGGETPQPPVTPTTPTVPVTPELPVGGKGEAMPAEPVALPAELPQTGASSNVIAQVLMTLFAALATYVVLYRFLPQKS